MLGTGVEPARHYCQGILSPQCLPFHHPSKKRDEARDSNVTFKKNQEKKALRKSLLPRIKNQY